MKNTRNQSDGKGSEIVSVDSLKRKIEDYVREDPMKAIGQAAAAGFVLRFLPLRSIFMTGIRLAAPLMLLNRLWAYTEQSARAEERSSERSESREKAAAR